MSNNFDPNNTAEFPVWEDDGVTDVQSLFKNPYFVTPSEASIATGQSWYTCMSGMQVFLFDQPNQQNNMFANGSTVYQQLGPQGGMPEATADFSGKFPAEALEKFRLWYNQGGRVTKSDPWPNSNIPNPLIPPPSSASTPTVRPFNPPANPVWNSNGTQDDIQQCFTNPCWISNGAGMASFWQDQMKNFQYDAFTTPPTKFDLQNYEHVKGWALNIYNHLASGSMPVGPPGLFSQEAIDAFRNWYNQGCPETPSQVGTAPTPSVPIQPGAVKPPFVLRKDINTLTDDELTTYRLQVMKLNAETLQNSTWQVGGFLHANWCLHYMQASFPWHRAHLLWLETQIGGPIPYWNFYSSQATDPTSPDSGIPQAFLDDTFTDFDGNVQPNPLRVALARDGKSRASTSTTTITEVQRAAELTDPTQRDAYISKYTHTYLDQIYLAMLTTQLAPQDDQGFTYATPDLLPDNPQSFYVGFKTEFDAALEQAHDNLHGWTGPDMANNSFAAFDPIFWSFHANFDRLFQTWVSNNPTVQWSTTAPLRPFQLGNDGTMTVIEGDPDISNYTTIGDMIQNSKGLGYSYLPPGNPDYAPPPANISLAVAPVVFFPNTKCTDKTYYIHVALDNGDGKKLVVGDPGYIGTVTRLGMGPDNGNNRCIQNGITRKLEAAKAAKDLGGLTRHTPIKLKVLVREDRAGQPLREVPESEYKDWAGFAPVAIWDEPLAGIISHD